MWILNNFKRNYAKLSGFKAKPSEFKADFKRNSASLCNFQWNHGNVERNSANLSGFYAKLCECNRNYASLTGI